MILKAFFIQSRKFRSDSKSLRNFLILEFIFIKQTFGKVKNMRIDTHYFSYSQLSTKKYQHPQNEMHLR